MKDSSKRRQRPRRRDPDASRQDLLEAALAEFSEHGLAGARTSAISRRAGVNKQLISHHFGGKQGLYRALIEGWLDDEAAFNAPDLPLADLLAGYVEDARENRRLHRLLLRAALDGDDDVPGLSRDDLEAMHRRQESGEVTRDLDPAFLLLMLQATVAAGISFPADVSRLTGLDPASPDFVAWQAAQLRSLIALLAPGD